MSKAESSMVRRKSGIYEKSGRYSQSLRDLLKRKDELDRNNRVDEYYSNYQSRINDQTKSANAEARAEELMKMGQLDKYVQLQEVDRIKSLLDLQIYVYEDPDLIEESIKEIETAMNKVKKPPIMKFLKDVGIDSYEIAREIYLNLIKDKRLGYKISMKDLLEQVELITQNAVDIALDYHERKKPFFFSTKRVEEEE